MTRLLVSVRDASEVAAALAGGADIIDVKDPSRGPMGMADAAVIAAVCAACAGKVPVSIALGELLEYKPEAGIPPGVDAIQATHVKLAMAGALDMETDWRLLLDRALAGTPQPIAVAYADHHRVRAPRPDDVLAWVVSRPFAAGLLIDTAVKDGADLFDWMTDAELAALIGRARQGGRLIALAGSLRGLSFARAAALGADILGVRGAACDTGGRLGRITAENVATLADIIAARSATPALSGS